MKRSNLKRSSPLRRGGRLRAGAKTRQWEECRRGLKKRFEAAGIVVCELGLEGTCWIDNALSFAHSKRRRFIADEDDLREVALVCTPCHDVLDALPHEDTLAVVRDIIAKRKVRV